MNEFLNALIFTGAILLFLFGGACFNHYVIDPLINRLVKWEKEKKGKHYR